MVGVSGTSRLGSTYYYYSCNSSRKKLCKKKNVPKWQIEDIVITKCLALLTTKNINIIADEVYSLCQAEKNKNTRLRSLQKQSKQMEKSIGNLLRAIEAGQNLDLINESLNKKRLELEEVKRQIAIEKSKFVNITKEQIKDFLYQLKNGNKNNIRYRKMLISTFVNKIFLYDDKITIIFNIGDTSVTADIPITNESTYQNNESDVYLGKAGSP